MERGKRAKELKDAAQARAREAAREARPIILSVLTTAWQLVMTAYAIAVRMAPQVLRVVRELLATGVRFVDAVRREAPRIWQSAKRRDKDD